ncbi:16S rRNA (uracil(1498)-N(3))-methyltransferase [Gynuella sp.]|uniref:16S rRNA (uracil(1498)-N(3))-methyltransferase n=1 Tax=Gynuella sp. TaxID=2969146 RepID=UPI003D0DBAB8
MRVPRIFTPQPLMLDSVVELETGASQHLLKVLRMKPGQELVLFNNSQNEFVAVLETSDRHSAKVRILQVEAVNRESPLHTHLGIVLSKGDRFEFALQKAVELGVTEVTPLTSERCEVRLKGERQEKKQQHWQQICVSACEQCFRHQVPEVHAITPLSAWLSARTEMLRLVLHPKAAKPIREFNRPQSVALLVGPEGGLSDHEIIEAEKADFNATLIGPRILRTETAPLVALTLLQAQWGDF